MKQYAINFSLINIDTQKELYARQFVLDTTDDERTKHMFELISREESKLVELISKDTVGPLCFGHYRIAHLMASSRYGIDEAIKLDLPNGSVYSEESDMDFCSNYRLTMKVFELRTERKRKSRYKARDFFTALLGFLS